MADPSIEFVQPLSVTFPLEGEDITITPVTVGEMPALLRTVEPMFGELLRLDEPTLARLAANQFQPGDVATLVRLCGEHGPRVVDAVALCSRRTSASVSALYIDRFAQLAAVCFQVNRDFFVRAMPGLRRTFEALASPSQAASPSAGQTPSSS